MVEENNQKFEAKSSDIIHSTEQKEERMNQNEQSLGGLWDVAKHSNAGELWREGEITAECQTAPGPSLFLI